MAKLKQLCLFLALAGFLLYANPFFLDASVQEEIEARNRQIEELNRQISEYENLIDQKQGEAKTLSNEIAILNAKIGRIQSEIKSLSLAIIQAADDIETTNGQIMDAQNQISKYRLALAAVLRDMDRYEREDLFDVLLKNANFSDFFNELNNIQMVQENLKITINEIKSLKTGLESKEDYLQEQKVELEELKAIQQIQQRNAHGVQSEKQNLLKITKGEESRFQQLAKQSKADIEKIRAQIFYLQQNGVTAEEAVKYGQLAAISAGIRPAFLLAILEIESGLGRNVGTGNWTDDMYKCYLRLGKPGRAEQEKNAFLAIVGKLGLNPDAVKVSREPNYGCGGAMGPAQFIPTTWLAYEEEVARLTGHHPPSPWSVEDAFTASALKLARGGASAQTKTSEIGAAKAYISGKSTCSSSICNYYANAVLRKAAEIEQNL